eukprot:854642-Prymnesium_polylepis.1
MQAAQAEHAAAATAHLDAEAPHVDAWAWNGLSPHRGMAPLRLCGASLVEAPPQAPAVRVNAHWRCEIGEVESIVQVHAWEGEREIGEGIG